MQPCGKGRKNLHSVLFEGMEAEQLRGGKVALPVQSPRMHVKRSHNAAEGLVTATALVARYT